MGLRQAYQSVTELRTRTDRRDELVGTGPRAWRLHGEGGQRWSHLPRKGSVLWGARHSGLHTEKRACSQHIYILCDIYIEGHTGVYMDLALSPSLCEWRCGPWRRWSCGGLVTRRRARLLLRSQAGFQGWVGWKGDEQKPAGASLPTPRKVASSSTGPRCLALQTLTCFGRGWAVRAPSSSPPQVGQDSPIPYPYPPPGVRPRATTTHVNVYHVILELSGEKCVPRLQPPSPVRVWVSQVWSLPWANPPQAWRGMEQKALCRPGARSRRIRSMFSTQPGTTSFPPRAARS